MTLRLPNESYLPGNPKVLIFAQTMNAKAITGGPILRVLAYLPCRAERNASMVVKKGAATPVMGGREWAMLRLALAVLWGGSFFFNGVAVKETTASFTLVWLRVACAGPTLLVVLRLLGQRMPMHGRVWLAFFRMGLLNNVLPFVLIVWGQHRIAKWSGIHPECDDASVYGPCRTYADVR